MKALNFAAILIMVLSVAGCRLFGSDESREPMIDQPGQNEIIVNEQVTLAEVSRERDFYKAVLLFKENESQYSREYLNAVALPKTLLRQDLKCLTKCNVSRLALITDVSCGLGQDELKALDEQIDNLICLPLEVRYTEPEERQRIVSGISEFNTDSYLVYCFRVAGDIIFHIKNNQIAAVITGLENE